MSEYCNKCGSGFDGEHNCGRDRKKLPKGEETLKTIIGAITDVIGENVKQKQKDDENYTPAERSLAKLINEHLWCSCEDRGDSGFSPNHAARVVLQTAQKRVGE